MLLDCVSPLCCVCPLCFCASALLRASALFYHIRSLARTWTTATLRFAFLLPPYGLRFYCHLTVCVSTATLRFAFLLPPYGLRFYCHLTVCVSAVTLPFAFAAVPRADARDPNKFYQKSKKTRRFYKNRKRPDVLQKTKQKQNEKIKKLFR
ncbi:hypothetical protein [Methanimicrococcus blatticola]|uniref:hypothetical protein n=1 Tax=Methanimicrococcus blatticola TaxID=91560 RepID=UPI001CC0F1B8|nr:hypothetical protein [Methanimicrococcus blatticola]MBZ3936059.1 hypothetical protein [Methanimicrococcus blatticola]